MKRVRVLAAVSEATTGVALLIVPSTVGQLLFGAELTGGAITVARMDAGTFFNRLAMAMKNNPQTRRTGRHWKSSRSSASSPANRSTQHGRSGHRPWS
jgi:hypothetical protein